MADGEPTNENVSMSIKADVTEDSKFPVHDKGGFPASDLKSFARTVSFTGGSEFFRHTKSMGRAAFVPLSYKLGDHVFNCVFVKGTGRQSNFDLFKTDIPAPFTYNQNFVRMEGEVIGSSSKKDQELDASNSMKLVDLGIKARIPLAGYFLDTIETQNGKENVQDLIDRGLIKEEFRPYISVWAMETPYRLSDLIDIIDHGSSAEINKFLVQALRFTHGIQNLKGLEDYLSNGNLNDTDKLLTLWSEVVLGGLENVFLNMRSNGITHGYMHAQNISLHMELCDNSTVRIGGKENEEYTQRLKDDWRVLVDGIFNLQQSYKERFPNTAINPDDYENRIRNIRIKIFEEPSAT